MRGSGVKIGRFAIRIFLLVGLAPACGPESAERTFAENARFVCELGHGVCHGEGVVEEAVETCEVHMGEKLELARLKGQACETLYVEFVACANQWTCDDYLDFTTMPDAPCQDLRGELNADCPGVSPFSQDRV